MKKKIILLIPVLLLSLFGIAQINPISEEDKPIKEIKIGEIRMGGASKVSCILFVDKKENDSTYTIFFSNAKYSTLIDRDYFSFEETGGDFERLYKLIEDNLKEKVKKEIEIPLKDGTLTLQFGKFMGMASMQMQWYSKGKLSYTEYFSLKQYKKLFGKDE